MNQQYRWVLKPELIDIAVCDQIHQIRNVTALRNGSIQVDGDLWPQESPNRKGQLLHYMLHQPFNENNKKKKQKYI